MLDDLILKVIVPGDFIVWLQFASMIVLNLFGLLFDLVKLLLSFLFNFKLLVLTYLIGDLRMFLDDCQVDLWFEISLFLKVSFAVL